MFLFLNFYSETQYLSFPMMSTLPFGVCGVHGSSAASLPAREHCGLPARCPGKPGMLSMRGNPARGCWKLLVSAPFHVSACARAARGDGAARRMLLGHVPPAAVQEGHVPATAEHVLALRRCWPSCRGCCPCAGQFCWQQQSQTRVQGDSWGCSWGSTWHKGALARPSPSPRSGVAVASEQQPSTAELSKSRR